MKTRLLPAASDVARSDLLFTFAVDGKKPSATKNIAAAAKDAASTGDYKSSFRAVRVFHPAIRGIKRAGFVGLGAAKAIDTEKLRRAAALAQQRAEALAVGSFTLLVDGKGLGEVGMEAAGRAIAEGLILGAYQYAPPRKERPSARKGQKAEVAFVGAAAARRAFARGFKVGQIGGVATAFTRDVENLGGNLCPPRYLAQQARKIADGKTVKVKVLEEREMAKLKMGALLGVSQGSPEPAKLIILDHKPAGAKDTVCVVGKGLTFDTGGISIKPSAKMDEMRYDMCGGGAVLGLFRAIADGALRDAKGKTRIIGIVAAVENMPDGNAQRPGDVVTAMDGTTIEVLNTDAEGRLVLADALVYAKKTFAPSKIIDLATLTGAVVVALGHEMAGVMGSDDALIEELITAGKATDEPVWQLPLWDCHREQVKSKFADIANLNSPAHGNGSTAGGAFLSYFVEDTPWAHLDIAGSAWGGQPKDYYRGGASGSMVRMLIEWVRSLR